MKIKYLGTAASEGFPAVFCNCEYCQKARELFGKNIRGRSQAIIDDKLLIDFPADTYHNVLTHGLRMDKVTDLLITHAHSDHFYPIELRAKVVPYAHNQEVETLNVYGGRGAFDLYQKENGEYNINGYQDRVKFNLVENFKPFMAGEYLVTALPARHDFGNDAMIYIIEKDGKKILYAHDTGIFYDEVYDYIEKVGAYFDFISLDCTNVELVFPDNSSHMGFNQIERLLKRLAEMNAIDDKTIKYVNHFSHNGNALQENVEKSAVKYGLKVAFDGEEIIF